MKSAHNLVATEDGSLSLFDEQTGELYHNRAGAYTEALFNYCLPSAAVERLRANGSLCLLDACFGLGYNSFVLLQQLLAQWADDAVGDLHLRIVAIELDADVLTTTSAVLQDERFALLAALLAGQLPLHFGSYKLQRQRLTIEIELLQGDLRKLVPALSGNFDLVFHDPFSARKVPELWTVDLFCQYYRLLSERKGSLLTYSAAKAVRGGLRDAGFSLFKTTAVGGKSGGTLATVANECRGRQNVMDLTVEELKVLAGRSAIPYRDNGFSSSSVEIFRRRAAELATGMED